MKTLNLVYPEKSDISYKISQFPDGQQDVVIEEVSLGKASGTLPVQYECDCIKPSYYPYQIKSRFNSFKDLELIICATKALRRLGVKEIHLYIPYLLGARSDRQFVEGGTSYLVDVIAPIINSLEFESVTVMDVHSDVAAACIKNLKVIDNVALVNWALEEIYNGKFEVKGYNYEDFVLISPDAGSLKKIYKVAEQIGYKGDIITCSKDRDTEGKLSKTVVSISPNYADSLKDHIIIDDICDGGATFINIAKSLKERYKNMNNENMKGKLYLIVTHGIFSKGFNELSEYFDGIYCTNSCKDITFPHHIHGYKNKNSQTLNIFKSKYD